MPIIRQVTVFVRDLIAHLSMLSYITSKSVSNNQWKDSLPHCLLDYRTTQHSATGCRPVDLFYSFNFTGHVPAGRSNINNAFVNYLKSKSKSKSLFGKSAINRKFEPNSEVKAFGGSKFKR